MEDEDFLQPSQFSRTQQRSNSTNPSQMVTSTMNSSPSGSQVRPSQPSQQSQSSQARSQSSFQTELSQIQDGLRFLTERIQQLSGDRGIKRPAEPKPNIKEECQICHKLYANKTTLFRHYQGIHKEMNPERFHGCSVNSTVVNLDASFRETQCPICAYVAPTQSALDAHNRTTHSNVVNANGNIAPTQNTVDAHNTNNVNNGNIKDKMHKCEECACYFEEKSKFDEHMEVQHGFEVVCKICNKNFLFKDIDGHVKEKHPDVYNKKRKDNVEKIIVEKAMKNKKGNRVHVYICTKCDTKMYDKMEAERHARVHKKGLKLKLAPRNKVLNAEESIPVVNSDDDNVILTCTSCDISTGSYDAAVEHSQNHITNNVQFVTQMCDICDLKFEPLCYKKHIDLHYRNKEIHRESFKYFKYRFEFLSFENWFSCFDMAEPVVKKIISESIYAHTRSVKMRVLREGAYKLYKCCKCDNFVDPSAVYNHTVNYDTCVKVKCSYPCKICKRTFNNRLAIKNHTKNHRSEDAYKIVLFNHKNDKVFNEVLNVNKLQNTASTSNGNLSKVLYKCLCGLCFVRKETADKHRIICPGKNTKNPCLKCNYFFTQEELVAHAFEHHQIGIQIVIENITPEVIVVDSDEEIIEIDSSDEDDAQNEGLNNIQNKAIKTDHTTTIQGSNDGEADKMNTIEMAAADAGVGNEEKMALEATTLNVEKTETVETDEDEDSDQLGETDNEMTDDDSQDTICYKNTETCSDAANQAPDINKQGQLKLVATNLLINQLYNPYENGFLKVWDIGALSREINSDIENVREQIETTIDKPSNEIAIKKEKSWLYDPTDFSHISKRQSLRQEMRPSCSNLLVLQVESLLTDDEETDINPQNEEPGHNDMRKDPDNNVSSNASTVIDQTINDEEEIVNEISHIKNRNDNTHKTINNIEDIRDRIEVDNGKNALTELNKDDGHGVDLNNTSRILNEEIDEGHYSDDDLFLPSLPPGIENRGHIELNNNLKEIPKDMSGEQVCNQVHLSNVMIVNDTTNVETENPTDTDSDETEHSTRSENEKNDSLNADSVINQTDNDNGKEGENEKMDSRPSVLEYTRTNKNIGEKDMDSRPSVLEYTPKTTNVGEKDTDSRSSATSQVVSSEPTEHQTMATDNIINIKREFQYMNIKIKRGLIDENENTENSCDKDDLVPIKREPNYILENFNNDNKENDLIVTENVNNDNYNNCCIV
ncbi:uncharacterized protein LOC133532731 [Cydia pomonella]|uniref:uncharacterized protein LOC133532731 n=1 Tax=Cydia pomonella TaxID=82600 RepID=UPI002ADD4CD8|nr:uncharacterized protein LOC133532731 [Cydia pomonella]